MKWFTFLVVAFSGMNLFFPSIAFTELEKPVVIESITHIRDSEGTETITFTLSASVVLKIFTLKGENPRLVIDFAQSTYRGKNVISLTDSVLASAIRLGLHQEPVKRTRAVIDLSKERTVQYASDYSELENTLIVTLTPDTTGRQSMATRKLQIQSQRVMPSQEELSRTPHEKKIIPPASPVKEITVAPADESIATPVVPTILEISFEDSSRGETVLFRLNDFSPPAVSAIEKDNPRVLCDFMATNMDSSVQKTILTNGKYIERIRTAIHHDPEKVRVVLDLSPNRDYDLQQIFFKKDNLFVLIVNELAPNQSAE